MTNVSDTLVKDFEALERAIVVINSATYPGHTAPKVVGALEIIASLKKLIVNELNKANQDEETKTLERDEPSEPDTDVDVYTEAEPAHLSVAPDDSERS